MLLRNLIYTLRNQKMAATLNVLGLSCALAVFAICLIQVTYELNYDSCYKNGKDIYALQMYSENMEDFYKTMCQPMFRQFEECSSHIKAMTLYKDGWQCDLAPTEGEAKKSLNNILFSYNKETQEMFSYQMVEGTFESIDIANNILIPESLARQFFGNEPAVGKLLHSHNGATVTVGGVFKDFPENSSFKNSIITKMYQDDSWSEYSYYGFYWLDTDDTESVLKDMYATQKKNNPNDERSEEEFLKETRLVRLSDMHFNKSIASIGNEQSSYTYLISLVIIALVVLFIAIINYMNFQMAMVPMRIRSINTQKVFGASTRSLRLSLIMEGVGIAIFSFLISLVWLYLLDQTPMHDWITAGFLPENNLDSMAVLLAIAIGTGIVSAIYPSFYITSFQTAMILKGSFGNTARGTRLRTALVSFQYTASFALILMSLLMNQQIHYMIYAPKGYDADYLITYDMGQNSKLRPHLPVLEKELQSRPFIENCATAESILSTQNGFMGWGRTVHGEPFQCETLVINSAEYLKTLGIKITGGRDFNDDDVLNPEGALIFNELARQKYNLIEGDVINPGKVVGFMDNINYATMSREIKPMCLWLNCQEMWGRVPNIGYVRVSKNSNMHEAREAVVDEIKKLCPEYDGEVRFVNEYFEQSFKSEQNMMHLLLICSLIAVLISLAGVFGMICFENQYHRKEIGLRKVLGDSTHEILLRLNRRYFYTLLIGFIVAAPLSVFFFNMWATSFAYRTPIPLWVFFAALALLSVITFTVITFQSWKTANENPINSIRTE